MELLEIGSAPQATPVDDPVLVEERWRLDDDEAEDDREDPDEGPMEDEDDRDDEDEDG